MNNPEKPKTMNLKRTMLAALVVAVLIPGGLWARGKTGNARIKVDIERQKGEIDRNIYGNFVEHLGRCIYGGLYEPGSPLSDEKGYRRDVLDATRALRTSLVRWPGGNFVSGYHWEDGIGPQAGRRRASTWHGASARATRSAPMSSSSGAAVPTPSPISA